MKQILIILGLFASVTTFAQSPRIKLNQITKDTVKGSVLISSPTDSGMVYSRDFYIAYGADTVLILYGDTLGGVGGGFASVLSDGVTVTGDGTTGNELKVDTATVISTIKGLVDTLTNRGYLTANQTITLSGDVTGSGTTAITATVVDDSHNHIISNVDFLQDSLNIKTNTDFSNVTGTLPVANGGTGATTLTANKVLVGNGTSAVLQPTNLHWDNSNSRLGINTIPCCSELEVQGSYRTVVNSGQGYTNLIGAISGVSNGFITTADASNQIDYKFHTGSNAVAVNITNSGNVGIGTTSPSEKLDVDGNARFRSIGSGASAGALHYTSTGVLTTNTSDARLKTNLQPLENTLNKLLNINTYTFNWINETDRVDLGMIAQEVEQIFPNLVFTNNVDGYKGIHYDKFSSILTKAIQEQQEQIETLQIELDAKSTEIDQLKTLITDLTNRLIILENK